MNKINKKKLIEFIEKAQTPHSLTIYQWAESAKDLIVVLNQVEAERDKLREVTPLIEKYISSIMKKAETAIGLRLAKGQMMMVRGECKLILTALQPPKKKAGG